MVTKNLNLENFEVRKFYEKHIEHFRKHYGDVVQLMELHVNSNNEVYSGIWIDSNGVINFCSGYTVDLVKTITFWKKSRL